MTRMENYKFPNSLGVIKTKCITQPDKTSCDVLFSLKKDLVVVLLVNRRITILFYYNDYVNLVNGLY